MAAASQSTVFQNPGTNFMDNSINKQGSASQVVAQVDEFGGFDAFGAPPATQPPPVDDMFNFDSPGIPKK